MDSSRHQSIIAQSTASGSRRSLVRGGLAALGLGALGLPLHPDETEARKQSRRKKKSRRHRRRNQNQGRNQGTVGNNPGGAAGADNPVGDFRATPCTRICAAGCDFTTVQAAIDAAPDGSALVICSGQFDEDITIGKNLTLAAVTGGEIILQGTGTSSVVTVPDTGLFNVTLQNVAIGKGIGTLDGSARLGGGIYFDNAGVLSLIGCEVAVSSADAGGGIYSEGQLNLIETEIFRNQAHLGGGIYSEGDLDVGAHCVIYDNEADQGGGIYSHSQTVTLHDGAKVQTNAATSDGGGIYNSGPAVVIDASFVQNNTAGANGGGILNTARGQVTLQNGSIIELNEAQSGGGVYNLGDEDLAPQTTVTAIDGAISKNKARGLGGGIFNDEGVVILQSATVFKNTAGGPGGGIFNTDGGSLTLDAESVVIENTPNNCIGSTACPA